MIGPILIEIAPTGRIEKLNGIPYRVYTGRTNTGVALEMLGLFRIADPIKRAEFENAVCSVKIDGSAAVQLLTETGLVKP